MNPPQFTLKLVVFVHFVLTTWALMSGGFLCNNLSYVYMNVVLMFLGVWSIAQHENSDAVLMYLLCHLFSIIQDIILLGLNEPRGYNIYEHDTVKASDRNEYRFALGMCITNLIIKPISAFLLYRIYKERGGNYGDLNIPGIRNLPGFGGGSPQHGPYENIDQPLPPNNSTGYPDSHPPPQPGNQPTYEEKQPMQ